MRNERGQWIAKERCPKHGPITGKNAKVCTSRGKPYTVCATCYKDYQRDYQREWMRGYRERLKHGR